MRKNCPVCGVENTGGQIHTWHKTAHRKKKYTVEQIAEMSEKAREINALVQMVCYAVDISRQPDYWVRRGKATTTKRRRNRKGSLRQDSGANGLGGQA